MSEHENPAAGQFGHETRRDAAEDAGAKGGTTTKAETPGSRDFQAIADDLNDARDEIKKMHDDPARDPEAYHRQHYVVNRLETELAAAKRVPAPPTDGTAAVTADPTRATHPTQPLHPTHEG